MSTNMSDHCTFSFFDELIRLVFGSFYPHLSEISNEMQAFNQPMQSVDQRDDFRTREEILVGSRAEVKLISTLPIRRTVKIYILQCLLIHLEEYLERGAKPRRLDFPPQSALVAPHAIHDAGNIPEMLLELFLQNLRRARLIQCLRSNIVRRNLTFAFSPRKSTDSSN